MQATVVPERYSPWSRFRENLGLIITGTLLLAITLYILTFFNSASARQRAAEEAAVKSRPVVTLVDPNLAVAPPAQQIFTPEDQVRAAIERANRAFVEARGTASSAPLLPVATGEWLAQEQSYINGLRSRGQTERWRLLELNYVQIQVSGNGAFVCTSERWEVVSVGANGVAGPARTVSYSEGYYLSRPGADWLVNRIEIG